LFRDPPLWRRKTEPPKKTRMTAMKAGKSLIVTGLFS
jgi:hypothetical protein